ncbi:major facilitator superfamily domain-containing protein [Radiomyces spectabilis]|uniref:major facilitator superfamily domain-containing protein n=1 Tax=Radiomyces spectabilis TaxID=64574 RepID=UPI002220101E|nr:major facilitator superfamily domain-containing protein [Radiomyces spectabilis]KAI8391116.1 major facilitator superfamily domain-containing protein [Radiomyces spectabilis]
MCIGTVVAPLGLILASFATELWHIYLSQGILFGIGAAFVFSTSITLPSQWFVKYRAFATGIAVSGSGVGGVALSPMSQNLIDTVGYRNALRAMGGMGFGILCIATALAFSRWKPPGDRFVIIDRSLINFHFCILLLFGLIVPFGYVAPFFLTPTYAAYINVDASRGATLVSVMSAMNAVCRIVLGFLADYIGRLNTMFIFTLIAGIFCMVIWQFATSYGSFVAYAVLYGLTGGGFVSLFPVVTADIVGVANIQRGLGMCYLATTVGNLLGTPIAGLLQKHFGWTAAIQFAGAPSVTAALVILVLRQIRSRGKIFMKI